MHRCHRAIVSRKHPVRKCCRHAEQHSSASALLDLTHHSNLACPRDVASSSLAWPRLVFFLCSLLLPVRISNLSASNPILLITPALALSTPILQEVAEFCGLPDLPS